MGFTLPHAEQTSLHHLEGIGLEVREQEKEPILRRRQGTVFVDGTLAGGAGCPIEAPRGHRRLERGLKGWDELLKLVERQAREIQELRGAGLQISEPYTSHGTCLLSLSRDVRGALYQKESGINSIALPSIVAVRVMASTVSRTVNSERRRVLVLCV